jgi:lysophospholipase L1-like esterase
LIVGDSLTHASLYPKELVRLFSLPGNPQLTLLGTHRPASAAPGVVHEGYGGWTWARFNTQYDPKADPNGKTRNSPFLFPDASGKAQLDIARYVRERCDNRAPDVVLFLLGINDCFGANPDDPKAMDASISGMFGQAERLLKAFHEAAPQAALGVCLTTPPNARESGFVANYKGKYHRWGWKRIQHRLVQRQLAEFDGRQQERIFVVPTSLNLDPFDGYPENNGVHPNEFGYRQVGASMYAWLKNYLNDTQRKSERP